MKTRIFKYECPAPGQVKQYNVQREFIYPGHIGFDYQGKLCMWAEVGDPVDRTKVVMYVQTVFTGEEVADPSMEWVGTAINLTGCVFHVFARRVSA